MMMWVETPKKRPWFHAEGEVVVWYVLLKQSAEPLQAPAHVGSTSLMQEIHVLHCSWRNDIVEVWLAGVYYWNRVRFLRGLTLGCACGHDHLVMRSSAPSFFLAVALLCTPAVLIRVVSVHFLFWGGWL
jgi:hypothetical protein